MTTRSRRLAIALLLLACVGCDQATKGLAAALLPAGRRLSLLGDTVRLELTRNPGAFLGAGRLLDPSVRGALFTWGVALLVLVALGMALSRRARTATALGAALIAGGGLGNLWDRVLRGGLVTDFLNLGVGPLRTGIFNLADVAIVAGVLLVGWGGRSRPDGPPAGAPGPGGSPT